MFALVILALAIGIALGTIFSAHIVSEVRKASVKTGHEFTDLHDRLTQLEERLKASVAVLPLIRNSGSPPAEPPNGQA